MELRLIQIRLPSDADEACRALLDEAETLAMWHEPAFDRQVLVRVLVEAENVEPVIDLLEGRFGHYEDFRAVILKVEATLPRPEEPEPEPEPAAKPAKKAMRISREELLADLSPGTKITRGFIATVILSAIVAAVGLLKNNVAVIIGAMVIAPLLAPNMALALATTLGDVKLMQKSLKTNGAGVLLAFAFAIAVGLALPEEPSTSEIVSRTSFDATDAILALASGIAGALAFTSGVPAGLVGVMVAVALMPPLIVGGLYVGWGEFYHAAHALILLAMNIICVNLAGVATFLVQGVRPRTWWEADKARRATRRALILWSSLLLALILLSFVVNR